MNRLGSSTSPYLLQHAENPVAWWPWSEQAFAEARERDLPVFLSIGYSACHWCHVMDHRLRIWLETAKPQVRGAISVRVGSAKIAV